MNYRVKSGPPSLSVWTVSHIDKYPSFQVLLYSLLKGQWNSIIMGIRMCEMWGTRQAASGDTLSGWFAGIQLGNDHAELVITAATHRT